MRARTRPVRPPSRLVARSPRRLQGQFRGAGGGRLRRLVDGVQGTAERVEPESFGRRRLEERRDADELLSEPLAEPELALREGLDVRVALGFVQLALLDRAEDLTELEEAVVEVF